MEELETNEYEKDLGDKIFKIRRRFGLSQEELGNKIGLSRQSISKWEQGQTIPNADNLAALCKVFSVSADYFLKPSQKLEIKCDVVCEDGSSVRVHLPDLGDSESRERQTVACEEFEHEANSDATDKNVCKLPSEPEKEIAATERMRKKPKTVTVIILSIVLTIIAFITIVAGISIIDFNDNNYLEVTHSFEFVHLDYLILGVIILFAVFIGIYLIALIIRIKKSKK